MSEHEHAPDALRLLGDLMSRGFGIYAEGGCLVIVPDGRLSVGDDLAIRVHREALLKLLNHDLAGQVVSLKVQPLPGALPAAVRLRQALEHLEAFGLKTLSVDLAPAPDQQKEV